jgi:hypothetical protein
MKRTDVSLSSNDGVSKEVVVDDTVRGLTRTWHRARIGGGRYGSLKRS